MAGVAISDNAKPDKQQNSKTEYTDISAHGLQVGPGSSKEEGTGQLFLLLVLKLEGLYGISEPHGIYKQQFQRDAGHERIIPT